MCAHIDVEVDAVHNDQAGQRKPAGNFCFGHGQTKSFLPNDLSYAKTLSNNKKGKKKNKALLDDNKMVEDLLASLPDN